MRVAIVGDANSGGDQISDLLTGSGYKAVSKTTERRAGHAEILELISINDKLVSLLGGSVDRPPRLADNWSGQPWLDPLYLQARNAIQKLNAKAEDWVFWHSATNMTAAFWQRVMPDLHFIVCVRNPRNVVAKIDLSSPVQRAYAYARWHWTYINLLSVINPGQHMTVVYDNIADCPQSQLELVRSLFSDCQNSDVDLLPLSFKRDGAASSIEDLQNDPAIHDAAKKLYRAMLSDDCAEISRQIASKDLLLSLLYPILERSAEYKAQSARCIELERELVMMTRSQVVAKNFGLVLATKAVHFARKSKELLSTSTAVKTAAPTVQADRSPVSESNLKITCRPNAAKIIVCAGNHRSGSTWLFNVVRCAHICAGYHTYGAWVEKYKPSLAADVHVVKTHRFHEGLSNVADLVVVSKRDLRDCAASIIRKKWVSAIPDEVASAMRMEVTESILPWRQRADIMVAYEDLVKDKVSAIAAILEKMGLTEVNPFEVHRWVENLPKEVYPDVNPTSLLHAKHITDGGVHSYDKTLSKEQIEAVNQVCSEFDGLLVHSESDRTDELKFRYTAENAAAKAQNSRSVSVDEAMQPQPIG